MQRKKQKNSQDKKALLLGLGMDNKDGHVRITKSEDFCLMGGSAETHDKMTETAIKFSEKLSERGKRVEELSKDEFVDILMDSSG